jgi:hypothetical protein
MLAGERQAADSGLDLGNPGRLHSSGLRATQVSTTTNGTRAILASPRRGCISPASNSGDRGGDRGPVPQERSRALGSHRLCRDGGIHQPGGFVAGWCVDGVDRCTERLPVPRGPAPGERRGTHRTVSVARSGAIPEASPPLEVAEHGAGRSVCYGSDGRSISRDAVLRPLPTGSPSSCRDPLRIVAI